MGELLRRAAVPVIFFIAGAGLEIGGYENRWLGVALFGVAGVYGIVALVTWHETHALVRKLRSLRIVFKPPVSEEIASLEAELAVANQRLEQAQKATKAIDAMDKDFKEVAKERRELAQKLQQSIADREELGQLLDARDRQIESLKAPSDLTTPYDDKLVQFVEAWLDRAFEKAITWLGRIRDKVQETKGGAMAELLTLGVTHHASQARANVQKRIRGDTDAPEPETLDALVTEMYRWYEEIVKWIWFAGSDAGVGFYEDQFPQNRWQDIDDKTMDKLRELVAAPDLASSQLRAKFREIEAGGSAKIFRNRILGYDR